MGMEWRYSSKLIHDCAQGLMLTGRSGQTALPYNYGYFRVQAHEFGHTAGCLNMK